VVTLAYIVLLVAAGLRAHSLALLSEAGHNVSGFLSLQAGSVPPGLSEPLARKKRKKGARAEAIGVYCLEPGIAI